MPIKKVFDILMIVSEDSVKREGVHIYTKRQPPNELILLQRLLERLPEDHPKQKAISEKLYQVKSRIFR